MHIRTGSIRLRWPDRGGGVRGGLFDELKSIVSIVVLWIKETSLPINAGLDQREELKTGHYNIIKMVGGGGGGYAIKTFIRNTPLHRRVFIFV